MSKKLKNFFANGALSKRIWLWGKRKLILKKQLKISKFWRPIIESYFDGGIAHYPLTPKVNVGEKKVIWQYWGQGVDERLPELVKLCFDSVDKYGEDYQIIRLDDRTIKDYIDLPEDIWLEDGEPKFKRVFFSDLLRLALLYTYGGIWIDATILLTGPIPQRFVAMDFFAYQRHDQVFDHSNWPNTDMKYWSSDPAFKVRMLTSIMFAQPQNQLIKTLFDLILYYWQTQSRIRHYFILQILFQDLITTRFKGHNCEIISDTYPHLLRMLLEGYHDLVPEKKLLELASIHKLTYHNEQQLGMIQHLIASRTL